MKERKALKEIYSQHENAIEIAIVVILLIASFIGGYSVSCNFMNKTLNDSQFELCEQVARDVYAQKRNDIIRGNLTLEGPEIFSVYMTETTVTVRLYNEFRHSGNVTAKLQNGELVMTRDMENGQSVIKNIAIGLLFAAATFFIGLVACVNYEKIKGKLKK